MSRVNPLNSEMDVKPSPLQKLFDQYTDQYQSEINGAVFTAAEYLLSPQDFQECLSNPESLGRN